MKILIDFDGTCVTHSFPKIGRDIGAVPVLKKLTDHGHQLILFTMRDNRPEENITWADFIMEDCSYLDHAIKWFDQNNIPLYGIQKDPEQESWTKSPKAYGQLIIDDTSLGIPLTFNPDYSNRPYVNWTLVEKMLEEKGLFRSNTNQLTLF